MLAITIEAKKTYQVTQDDVEKIFRGDEFSASYQYDAVGRILSVMYGFYVSDPDSRWFDFCTRDQSRILTLGDMFQYVKWSLSLQDNDATLDVCATLEFCIEQRGGGQTRDSLFNRSMVALIEACRDHGVTLTSVVESTPDVVLYSK